jgi:hypothetical protein
MATLDALSVCPRHRRIQEGIMTIKNCGGTTKLTEMKRRPCGRG